MTGQRIRELIAPLGFAGGKTIVDDYVDEVRPFFVTPARTYQRTVCRPGEICQFDVWQPREELPVGHGQTRRGWVVVACLGYSRAGARAVIFSKKTPDLVVRDPAVLVVAGRAPADAGVGSPKASGLHAHEGRPTEEFAGFLRACSRSAGTSGARRDPEAKGCVERLQDFMETLVRVGAAGSRTARSTSPSIGRAFLLRACCASRRV